jgi:predicted enzyme related to lactoylglutathione lyase
MLELWSSERRVTVIHNIIHFEVPADDVERARKFYQGLFGWKIEPAEGGYNLITVGEPGPNGGMMARQVPGQGITVYINVESVDDYSKKIQSLGGTIVMPKTPVPTMGYFAVFIDTEGNALALWEVNDQAA